MVYAEEIVTKTVMSDSFGTFVKKKKRNMYCAIF